MTKEHAANWPSMHIVGATLGVVAIILALVVSGYAAMAAGFIGGALALADRGPKRKLALLLCGLGFLLGLSAQVMKVVVDASR